MPEAEMTKSVGGNPNEPRPPRPEGISIEQDPTGQKVLKRSRKVQDDISGATEIESVTLVKDGREFTIAKSIWDVESAKPETAKDIKEGQPVLLRHPDLVGAKLK